MSGADGPDPVEPDAGLEVERPNPARMYDYALGGSANFQADRDAAEEVLKRDPEGRMHARANRAFLRRVVRELVALGVRQFIDLGSGVPTVGHVHEIARRADPDARVLYVDNEPVACTYSRQILADVPGTGVLSADLRDVNAVLDHRDTRRLIALGRPVAVLLLAVLHFVVDDRQVADLVAAYRDRTAPGSYLVISHACRPSDAEARAVEDLYRTGTSMPFRYRATAEVRELFAGYELLEPGVVPISDWRPEPGPDPNRPGTGILVGGVGRH